MLLAASLVFAVLSTLRRGERLLFLWNWGVLLTAINMLAFPLCYSLPLRRLTKRFVKSGSALAGYVGADRLRRSNCVILTDTDLVPAGNGQPERAEDLRRGERQGASPTPPRWPMPRKAA